MLYAEYMKKAKNIAVSVDETTGFHYLDPDWKEALCLSGLNNLSDVKAEYELTWDDVENVLKLEAEKRNKQTDKQRLVVNWLFDLITTTVDPAMLQEETEYVAHVMDYLKFKSEHPEQTNESEEKNETSDETIKQLLKSGMSFTKN